MIAFLTGRVTHKGVGHCLLDVNGVGYRLNMSTGSLAALPSEGVSVTVHTFLYVREEELSLFGFESEPEKNAFELLLTVSGVGPKVALATLSALTADTLAAAVTSEDVALISSVPGIGKKTAQRIILDLTDKFGAPALGASAARASGPAAVLAETTDALLGMGFSAAEAAAALKGYDGSGDAQDVLRYALKRLGGGS